jgi:hypothetical protein
MKVVLLHPTVKGLIDELRKLPSNHTPPEGAPIKQCICPYEEALDLLRPVPAKTVFS